MFSACIFCHAPLGANESIEHFPVGRRLAFDTAKGRLWVVCRRCERWNLTPLEERWEALAECERRFRDTRLRVSTDEIGLSRLRDGLELVRIGQPLRPELAAWRYGDQFRRRRRRTVVHGALGATVAGAILIGGPVTGLLTGGAISAANVAFQLYTLSTRRYATTYLPHPQGGYMAILPQQRDLVRIDDRAPPGESWVLEVPYARLEPTPVAWWKLRSILAQSETGRARLTGADAILAVGRLLPRINATGASAKRVQEAVRLIEEAGDPERYFSVTAVNARRWFPNQFWGDMGAIRHLPHPVRLALEMAAHEDSERRALEGELALLERAWRDAEEIAAIADNLLLPNGVEEFLRKARRTATAEDPTPDTRHLIPDTDTDS